jgi:hypothetical protein
MSLTLTESDKEWIKDQINKKFKAVVAAAVVAAVAAVGSVVVPVVKPTDLVESGPIKVKAGESGNIQNYHIVAKDLQQAPNGSFYGAQGISCDDGAKSLTVSNSHIESHRYGMWLANDPIPLPQVTLNRVRIDCAPSGRGDGDDYCARGFVSRWESKDCTFTNVGKGCIRIYGCIDFKSTSDSFSGGRLMLGGGSASEWDNVKPFAGTITEAKISCKSVETYRSVVTFIRCNFSGTGHIFTDGKFTLVDCSNVPQVNKGSNAVVSIN